MASGHIRRTGGTTLPDQLGSRGFAIPNKTTEDIPIMCPTGSKARSPDWEKILHSIPVDRLPLTGTFRRSSSKKFSSNTTWLCGLFHVRRFDSHQLRREIVGPRS